MVASAHTNESALAAEAYPKTEPLYFKNTYLFKASAKVLGVKPAEGAKDPHSQVLVLDQTICHPQGGGQPSDSCSVVANDGLKFNCTDIRSERESGIIQHIGRFEPT